MGRRAKIWQREDRPGFFATIGGRQRFLALDKKAAEREFHLLKGGREEDEKDIALSKLVDAYLEQLRGKPNTVRVKRFFCDSLVKSVGKSKRVSQIKPRDIELWYRDGWNDSSRHSAATVIFTLLRWGAKAGLCGRNELVLGMKRPRMGSRKPLTPAEIQLVLGKSPPELKAFATVLLTSGARPGELMGAKVEHYQDGIITREEHKTADKTGKPRKIYLTDQNRKIVEELIAGRVSGYIFRNSRKGQWTQEAVSVAMTKLGTGICAYRLRHTFCSNAINSGMDSALVAKLLGHTSPATLYKFYWKEDDEVMRRAAEQAVKKPL